MSARCSRFSSFPSAWLVLFSLGAACTPSAAATSRIRPPRDPVIRPCSGADAGPRSLPDAVTASDDAPMSTLSEPFTIEPESARVSVYAAERTFVAVRLDRALGHSAYVELKASGLPAGVSAIVAFGPSPTQLGLVIEASDTARAITDVPFTLEAHADGVRVSRRMLLTIVPERPAREE